MPRLPFYSRPHGASPRRLNYAPAAHRASQSSDSRYRRTCFEQLEERRALATITFAARSTDQSDGGGSLARFEAAVFPRVIQVHANLDLAPDESRRSTAASPSLRLTRQQDPLLELPSANGRPVVASIDRIQATGIEANVKLRKASPGEPDRRTPEDRPIIVGQANSSRLPSADIQPIGRSAAAAMPLPRRAEDTLRPAPANLVAKTTTSQQARVAVADAEHATASQHSQLAAPARTRVASNQRDSIDYSAFEAQSSAVTGDNADATELLFRSRERSQAPPPTVPAADGRDYLSGTQTLIFATAAVATALVLPGIVSEIRRHRKQALPQFARAGQPPTDDAEDSYEPGATTYTIRERAG
jgi:hypothetical protein